MSLHVVTPPRVEPMSLDEAKAHLRVSTGAKDALIAAIVAAARQSAEETTRRRFVATRLRLTLDSFPRFADDLQLGCGPVLAVESISYINPEGERTTFDASDYALVPDQLPGRIALTEQCWCWPLTHKRPGCVTVTFVAGHAAAVAFDSAADTVTLHDWPALAVGDPLYFTVSGGALPAPLVPRVPYYVVSVEGPSMYKLASAAGDPALDLTGESTGQAYVGEVPPVALAWMKLRLGALDAVSDEVTLGVDLKPLPFADRLLDPLVLYGC